ncbi:DUF943 family protein [Pantoea sp. B65]|uniref:DUF943 family protein n=1 Tax=Pantoea sp. B65 TaxID=2813359 RepID=UPI0039B5D0C4
MNAYKNYFISAILLAPALIWLLILPTKIHGIHRITADSAVVVVNNFPASDAERIQWWRKHQLMLQQKSGIPATTGDYTWFIYESDYTSDFTADNHNELLCFSDMKNQSNCIRKDHPVLRVRSANSGCVVFTMDYNRIDSREYRQPAGSNELYQVY